MNARNQITVPEWRKPVVAVPLTQAFPELNEVKEFKSKVCLFNHDRTRVFDVVSDKYHVIDHGQALDVLTEAVQGYFTDLTIVPTVRSFNGGARVAATIKIPVAPIVVKKGDVTEVSISVRNSYDRSAPFNATLAGLRLICTNGMKTSDQFGSINAKHVGTADPAARNADIYAGLERMVQSTPELQNLWREWAETRVTYDEAVALLAGKFPEKYLLPVLDTSHFPRSKWDLYNDLTRFATHDTKTIQRRLDFDDRISKLFYATADES